MAIKIIPAIDCDRDFFIFVHHESYRPVIEKMFGWDLALQDQKAGEAFDLGHMNIILQDREKIGVFGLEERPDYFWLKEFFILPEAQNQRIGSGILENLIHKAKKSGKEIRLRTLKTNLNAKRFYERLGFVVSAETDIHWKMAFQHKTFVSS